MARWVYDVEFYVAATGKEYDYEIAGLERHHSQL